MAAQSAFLKRLLSGFSGSFIKGFADQVKGQRAAFAIDNAVSFGMVPIGAIIAWTNHLTGTPALPTAFKLCDGTVISDADSPMNGQTVPALNSAGSDPIFLGGYTASALALVASNLPTHTHAVGTYQMPAHSHPQQDWTTSVGASAGFATDANGSGALSAVGTVTTAAAGPTAITGVSATPSVGDGSANNFPHHQKVIWAMRIK